MINIKSIKPLHTKILTTAECYDKDVVSNGLIMKSAGSIKEYQKVVAVGPMIRDIKVGDIVMLNPSNYIKRKFSDNSLREDFVENPIVDINIPTIKIDGVFHFYIDGNCDIEYVIDDYEELPEDLPKSTIIQPKPVDLSKPNIIV